jgi:hypothetical protein
MLSQMVDRGSELLQGFPGELGPSFQLRVERCFQAVVTAAIQKRLSNLLVLRSTREAMYNMGSQPIQGGDKVCGFLAERPVVVLHRGLELSSECGP